MIFLILGMAMAPCGYLPSWANTALGSSIHSNPAPQDVSRTLSTLDGIMEAFTQGLAPDLTDLSQRQAFEVYLYMKFGAPQYRLNPAMFQEIIDQFKKYPQLVKAPFRDYRVIPQQVWIPISPALNTFTQGHLRRIGEVAQQLYQIDAQVKFWKKIFPDKGLDSKEWSVFFDTQIPPETRLKLANSDVPLKDRAVALYSLLSHKRQEFQATGKEVRLISRALIDVIHTFAFQDPGLQEDLHSKEGLKRILAFRQALVLRNQFALELGISAGFAGAVKALGGVVPTGVASEATFVKSLDSFEQEIKAEQAIQASQNRDFKTENSKLIRHLSLEESPFRSCLGGDCATRTYLTKALDPNYHYFTLTDRNHVSEGQIAVVLGTSIQNGLKVKTAFLDKIQGFPLKDLPSALEGVRLSVLEQGYILGLPDDLGDHNGLSNENEISKFVRSHIPVNKVPMSKMTLFEAEKHPYLFFNQYSRAHLGLPCSPILPLSSTSLKLKSERIWPAWKSAHLGIEALTQSSANLKNSPQVEDRLRYITIQEALESTGLKADPSMESVLRTWIQDRKEKFSLRKKVLVYFWLKGEYLLNLLENFEIQDQVQLLQNLLDTPRFRDSIYFGEATKFHELLFRFRKYPRVLDRLFKLWFEPEVESWFSPLLKLILDSDDGWKDPSHQMMSLLQSIVFLGYPGTDSRVGEKVLELVSGQAIEPQLREVVSQYFIAAKKSIPPDSLFSLKSWAGTLSKIVSRPVFQELLARSPSESFDFIPIVFPPEGVLFKMGSPEGEPGRRENEIQRPVKLTRAFEMQRTPVTWVQWEAVLSEKPLPQVFGHENGYSLQGPEPVTSISYSQVAMFIQRLNDSQEEYSYRLPTEAEWEYVMRAGTESAYPFGPDLMKAGRYSWFGSNSNGHVHPVATLWPNTWGFYDLGGNVYEMTQTIYYGSPSSILAVNPPGDFDLPNELVTLRGGAFHSVKSQLRSAFRSRLPQGAIQSDSLGFRLVRVKLEKRNRLFFKEN